MILRFLWYPPNVDREKHLTIEEVWERVQLIRRAFRKANPKLARTFFTVSPHAPVLSSPPKDQQ